MYIYDYRNALHFSITPFVFVQLNHPEMKRILTKIETENRNKTFFLKTETKQNQNRIFTQLHKTCTQTPKEGNREDTERVRERKIKMKSERERERET